MRWRDWLPFGRVPEMTPEDLAKHLQGRPAVQLLDVRTSLEYQQGHIPDAVNVPLPRLATTLPRLGLDRALPVVAICKTAHRSIPAVRLLRGAGFTALQLAGGMDRWRRLGLPTTTDGAPDRA